MRQRRSIALAVPLALLIACGGSSGSRSSQTGTVNLLLSDSGTEDWSVIGVKVLSVALVPQGGGADVTVFTASSPAPTMNLVQLDQLAELLGDVAVPPGTYTAAVVTVAANPGDVQLTASADPEAGFPVPPGTSVPADQIQVQGAVGSAGSRTVPITVKLETPLVVTTGASAPLDLEVDLAHPAFLVEHVTAAGAIWAVNLDGPLHHHPLRHLGRLILRQLYGTVTSVAADSSALTFTKDYPARPVTHPETAVATSRSLTVQADATNGTLYYDVDAKTQAVIKDFSSLAASIAGKYVRVAARFQDDGTLVAVRLRASSSFDHVWLSPEGHVLHVDAAGAVLTVENDEGRAIPLTVDAGTKFFFRTPERALDDTTPIGTGPAFLSNLERGFKVHASVVDPLASTLVARTVDIEIARFDGVISAPTTTGFTCTRRFATVTDDYLVTLPYISATTPNGYDASGNAILGFKWWNLTFPTLADTGAGAISDFVTATGGTVSFGGTVRPLRVWGESQALWNDPASPNGWAATYAILVPQPAPLGMVATPWAASSTGGNFGLIVSGGTSTVTVDVSSVAGSATRVYQVDRSATGIVTISVEDLTTAGGLAVVAGHLVDGAPVKVYGVPRADGSIEAYVLLYFTGTTPTT